MQPAYQYEPLWESLKEGDKAAFAEIYNKHIIVLLNYGSKISPDSALVEDCIQDLFIELWQRRAHLSSTTSIKFYLFKALRNRICRYKGTRINGSESFDGHLLLAKESSYEDRIIQMEVESFQMRHLREKVEELPPRQREAINLRYYHNFSNEEIAQLMGVTYPAACKFIYAGLKKLVENVQRRPGLLWLGLLLFKS